VSRRADPSRRAAFDVLRAVQSRDAYANLVLPGMLRDRRISGRDAAFATELAYGTLRGLGTYDAVLAECVDRPLDNVDPPALDLLRLGTHQILGMRVASHGAVSATVDLARSALGPGVASFVNAVLRRVCGADLDGWLARVAPPSDIDPIGHLAIVYSHPSWIVQALKDAVGGSLAETEALLAADNVPPAVSLVARPGRSTVGELVSDGGDPGRWSPFAVTWPAGDPGQLPAVASGRAGVQDEGSQLVALALASANLEGRDEFWLDMCAGPGGKAALLAAVGAARGVRLVAADRQVHRARLVRKAIVGGHRAHGAPGRDARVPMVVVADALHPAWQPGGFDRVLADVPCTGLGALRRRPEARWRRRPEDLPELTRLQRRLLRSAVEAVRPGGLVAYVTCSPHLAETDAVVNDVLAERPDLIQIDARPFVPRVPQLGPGPSVRLWPHVHGTDAMFLALLRRTA